MKRTLFLVLAFLLTACQSAPDADSISKFASTTQERRIGEIKVLGDVFNSDGATHMLNLDDGTTILLKSENVDLSAEKYLQNSVELTGIINSTVAGKSIMNVSSIDIIETDIDVNQTVPQWKDYDGDIKEISFKYRDDFELDDSADEIVLIRKVEELEDNDEALSEITIKKSKYDDLAEFLGVESLEREDLLAENLQSSKVGQYSYQAYKQESSADEIIYYIPSKQFVYEVAVISSGNQVALKDKNMYFDILGSLKISTIETEEEDEPEELSTQDFSIDYAADPEIIEGELDQETVLETVSDESETVDTPPTATEIDFNLLDEVKNFESDTFGFSVEYPKSFYFEAVDTDEDKVVRQYQFGSEPLEDKPGEISFQLMADYLPEGQIQQIEGKDVVVKSEAGTVEVWVDGNSRIYKVIGPATMQDEILTMALSIEEK